MGLYKINLLRPIGNNINGDHEFMNNDGGMNYDFRVNGDNEQRFEFYYYYYLYYL